MKKLLTLLSAGFMAFAVVLFLPRINSADAAAFMKIADIKGEASDKDHKDWIVIESISPPLKPTARAAGRRQHKPLTVTKAVDKASPKLHQASNSGKVFPTVIIEVAEYGGSRATYLKYELKNVMITSYSVNDSGTSGEVPMETITFSYSKIEYKYDEGEAEKMRKKRKKDR
ncbi:MAG: type VI secretion system tube protein Hcp [Proteobacteria bacterium]|nr:type VI secretion system tube protein Hcp [Pseudomonadota bacterium]